MNKYLTLLIASLFAWEGGMAQSKLVLEDRTGTMDEVGQTILATRLADQELELTTLVDFSNKCDYWFGVIREQSQGYLLELRDCEDKLVGRRAFGAEWELASQEERAFLLATYLRAMISQPQPVAEAEPPSPPATPEVASAPRDSTEFPPLANEHHTRYYFSPSAFNIRKNEFYYNSLNFLIHDIQYGFSNNFSLGLGTSVAFVPMYITPKLSFQLGEKHHLAVGDLFIYGTWGLNNYGNLAYAAYTYGSLRRNLTIGLGWANTDADIAVNNRPVISLAAMTDFGQRLFFVTEHYFVPYDRQLDGWREIMGPDGYPIDYENLTFYNQSLATLGFLGVRFVSKKRNTTAFQFGVGYFMSLYKDERSFQYEAPYSAYNWNNLDNAFDPDFYLIPTMSFTYKFGSPVY